MRVVQGDLSTREGVDAIAEAAVEVLGGVDVLVNNAGAAGAYPGGLGTIPDEAWVASMNVNLLAAVRLTTALLEPLRASVHGSIVNVSSSSAHTPAAATAHYAVAKAAVHAFTKAASLELAPHGVRVNTVVPGKVETTGGGDIRKTVAEAMRVPVERLTAGIALGRIGQPTDIAAAVAFLVSEDASWITGAELVADGGEDRHA